MKMLKILFFVWFVASVKMEFVEEKKLTVVNGKYATTLDYPWTAAINIGLKYFYPYAHSTCAGAIVSKTWVLTAAHCMQDEHLPTFGYFFIRVGSDESTRWGDTIYIKRIIIHPEYNNTSEDNDIALIELNEELKFNRDWIQPIQLADESFKVLENLTVRAAAYGQTCDTCSDSVSLMEVELSICIPLLEIENEKIICAADPKNVQTCK